MSWVSSTQPMSRTYTVGLVPGRMTIWPSSFGSLTTELTGTIGALPPTGTVPDGLMSLPLTSASTTSSGDMWYAFSRSGSVWMTMVRWLPPNGGGADTPGKVANIGRTWNRALSWISAMVLVSLWNTR